MSINKDITTTKKLEGSLKVSNSIDDFLNDNNSSLITLSPGKYIVTIMQQKNISKSKLLKSINLSRSYFYEILSEKKLPSRNNFIQLLLGLELPFEKCQHALKTCNYSPLYARNRWDAIIIYCIENKKNLIETNIILESQNMPILY